MRLTTQVDLPKMKDGGLDVSFMIVYVGPVEPASGRRRIRTRRLRAGVPRSDREVRRGAPADRADCTGQIELARSAADVLRIAKSGKKVAVIGVENGYPIGTDLRRVKEFYDLGGRYLSLAHNGHNQLADSNSGEPNNQWRWGGLSPLGRQVIEEMNRLGMMVDVSHPSKGADDAGDRPLEGACHRVSFRRPEARQQHPQHGRRDADGDEDQRRRDSDRGACRDSSRPIRRSAARRSPRCDREFGLVASGRRGAGGWPRTWLGATLSRPVRSRIRPARAEPVRQPARVKLMPDLPPSAPSARHGSRRRMADIDKRWPAAGRASVRDFVDHIDYAVKLIGIDHVGISSDFDGGGGIDGWNNAAETFNVTLELVRRGYTEEQIAKIWSGNLLRVWGEVERVARQLQQKG